ncbi:hypothetical protein ABT215_11300 [Streptomyces sp900105755]|uniref:hypothetical protein n=1 Tax=Streptomyces sp. 900105755 TaxID=3154389 RepID=UPI003324C7DD
MKIRQWLEALPYRDEATGLRRGYFRWTPDRLPTPFGCRWCGTERGHHGRQYLRGRDVHTWEQPTQAQIKARMLARRAARKAVCRCPRDEDDYYRPFAPVFDPYACEADDCHGHTSELNPFGMSRSVHEPSAEVSVKCGQCDFRTSVWHVDDGSAEEELHGHVVRVHGGGA